MDGRDDNTDPAHDGGSTNDQYDSHGGAPVYDFPDIGGDNESVDLKNDDNWNVHDDAGIWGFDDAPDPADTEYGRLSMELTALLDTQLLN